MSILAAAAVPHPPLIMPEVGRGEERGIHATIDAYKEVARRLAELRPELVLVSSPHTTMYADYFHISPGSAAAGSFQNFRAPDLKISVNYDTDFVKALVKQLDAEDFPAGTKAERAPWLDHATMIPLRFLRDAYERLGIEPNCKVVRIGKGAKVTVPDTVALGSGSAASRTAGDADAYLKGSSTILQL